MLAMMPDGPARGKKQIRFQFWECGHFAGKSVFCTIRKLFSEISLQA
jgi:hypothetical protein